MEALTMQKVNQITKEINEYIQEQYNYKFIHCIDFDGPFATDSQLRYHFHKNYNNINVDFYLTVFSYKRVPANPWCIDIYADNNTNIYENKYFLLEKSDIDTVMIDIRKKLNTM